MINSIGKIASLILILGTFGCQNSLIDRSLIFSTHTNLGLEISMNPAEMNAPVKMQIGYQRVEGVLNPVYYNHDFAVAQLKKTDETLMLPNERRSVNDYYRDHAYSVIAKFEGDVKGSGNATSNITAGGAASGSSEEGDGGNADKTASPNASFKSDVSGGMTLSQWFATGKAAELLAQHGAARVLTDNPGVANAGASTTGLQRLSATPRRSALVGLARLYRSQKGASTNPDLPLQQRTSAANFLKILDGSKNLAKIQPIATPLYSEADEGKLNTNTAPEVNDFGELVTYHEKLHDSVDALQDVFVGTITQDASGNVISAEKKKSLLAEFDVQREQLKTLTDLLLKDKAIADAFKYLAGE